MQIVFHCGVHGTDQDGLLKTLMNNRDWLTRNGTEVVSRNRHRGIFESALTALKGRPATPDMEDMMLDAILDSDQTKRVICSQPAFLGVPNRAITPDGIYPVAGTKLAAMANLFPSAEVEFFIGLKNPATFAPYCHNMAARNHEDLLGGIAAPHHLRWGPAIRRLLPALQGRRLVLWCHEDTPLIWPEVMRIIADMPLDAPLKAGLHILGEILEPEGIAFIRQQVAEHDQITIAQRRGIFAQALQEFVRADLIETTIDLPGWSQDLIDRMTEDYDQDVAELASLPNVEFISP